MKINLVMHVSGLKINTKSKKMAFGQIKAPLDHGAEESDLAIHKRKVSFRLYFMLYLAVEQTTTFFLRVVGSLFGIPRCQSRC